MIEQYYIVLGCTLIVLMLAGHQAKKWWRKRYPVRFRVGDTVTFGDGRSTYYVLDTRGGDHPMFPHVVFVDVLSTERVARLLPGHQCTYRDALERP